MARRPRKKFANCSSAKVLALVCRWQGCNASFELQLEDYQTFAEHVFEHKNQVINALSSCNAEEQTSFVSYKCSWSDCSWEVRSNPDEYSRHVMFHAYHSRLKCLGAFEMILENANQCGLDVETQDLLPDVSAPFLCKWDSCGMNLLCPDKFYRHVEMHGYNAGKEDVMVVTEEEGKLYSCPSSGQTLNGMAVQKMMQSVCRWEGCSFLAKSAVKIKDHCRTHTGERQLACPTCGGFFSNKTKFVDHLTRQNAKLYENFQCSHCLKRCASERLLRDHMRHHVNHVKCPHCDMTCANPSSLRGHIKFRHSLDRPFKCAMCHYSCKTSNDLKRHEETHFSKRFPCEAQNCLFFAKTLAGLRSHIKLVHEHSRSKDRFMCHICQRKFSRGYFLTLHLKTDHDFTWPSGHSRFRYKQYEDGFYRLQMVRFESAELSEQLTEDTREPHQDIGPNLIDNGDLDAIPETSASRVANKNIAASVTATETTAMDSLYASTSSTTGCSMASPMEVSLCEGYVEMLHYYEAVNAGEKEVVNAIDKGSIDLLCRDTVDENFVQAGSVESDHDQLNQIGRNKGKRLHPTTGVADARLQEDLTKNFNQKVSGTRKSMKSKNSKRKHSAKGIVSKANLQSSDDLLDIKNQTSCDSRNKRNSKSDSHARKYSKSMTNKPSQSEFSLPDRHETESQDEYESSFAREDKLSPLSVQVDVGKDKTCKANATTKGKKSRERINLIPNTDSSKGTKRKRFHSALNSDRPHIRKSKRSKKETKQANATDALEKSHEYEQVILDVSRTLLSLHNADNNDDGRLIGIPF